MGRVVSWTGHPFVDAGLAAIAAVAKVQDLAQLTPLHLEQAAKELKRVLLSDQSLGVGVEKSFAKGALSQLFPNSELVNTSNWKGETPEQKAQSVRQKYEQAIDSDLRRAKACLQDRGSELCGICGNHVLRRQRLLCVKIRFHYW
jgi:CRISPR-associated protein Cst1